MPSGSFSSCIAVAIDAEIVERVAIGIVLARIELGDEEQLLVGGHRRFERRDRFLAPDEQRNDAVRENDDVAKRKDGEKASHDASIWAAPTRGATKARNNPHESPIAVTAKEATMADDREKISTGPTSEPLNETIAGTGPGIPDDSAGAGEKNCPSRRATRRSSGSPKKLGAPTAERDTLPLEGE